MSDRVVGDDSIEDYCIRAGQLHPWAAKAGREIKRLKAELATLKDNRTKCEEPDERPCCLCGKMMESAAPSWETHQPYGGGEIMLLFAFGSRKFDDAVEGSGYRGLICDECAEPIVAKMDRQ